MTREAIAYRIDWTLESGAKGTDTVCMECMAHEDAKVYENDPKRPLYSVDEDSEERCSVCGCWLCDY